jgi:hypothetical protein
MHRGWVAAAPIMLIVVGCASNEKAPQVQPAPVASPPTSPAGGFVNNTRCNALRVTIKSNQSELVIEETAGHDDAAAALRAKIRADVTAARAIRGCPVADLPTP